MLVSSNGTRVDFLELRAKLYLINYTAALGNGALPGDLSCYTEQSDSTKVWGQQ